MLDMPIQIRVPDPDAWLRANLCGGMIAGTAVPLPGLLLQWAMSVLIAAVYVRAAF